MEQGSLRTQKRGTKHAFPLFCLFRVSLVNLAAVAVALLVLQTPSSVPAGSLL